ncbi:MAG: hypothetical protein FWF70_06465 [Bacteroidetes bacterium]|nr:hypothetical protein [Bacteroidota bacterium]MCL1968346.1 hypothetical protein [Bacteroidota bacterium]
MEKILIIREKEVTSIVFKEEWQNMPLVIYASGLGKVRDLIRMLPLIKKLNVKFFLDSAVKESYEAVQILSSLGGYAGIVINKNADWEKLTDLMYYALCTRIPHAPIEPFQYVYDTYQYNTLVDYGAVFLENTKVFKVFTTENTRFSPFGGGRGRSYHKGHNNHPLPPPRGEKAWQEFFYEATPCAACEGWRICLGKFAAMEDKTGCRNFTIEWLHLMESIKFKKQTL